MKAAPHPRQELRLAALRRYEILDTPREAEFDEIAQLTASICDAPIAVINLIDAERQWFKAEVGLGVRETPLETSLCSHVILERSFVEIPDTLADPRMCDNPLCVDEDGLRFYAGALLSTPEGLPIGTLCVLDKRPRQLTALQRNAIQVLARQVMTQLDLRRSLAAEQIQRNEIDHRVKNSLAAVAGFVALERRGVEDPEARQLLDRVGQQINTVALLHRQLSDAGSQRIDLSDYLSEVTRLIDSTLPDNVEVRGEFDSFDMGARDASVLGTIVNELAANAVKHSVREAGGAITFLGETTGDGHYRLTCRDAGKATSAEAPAEPSKRTGLGLRLIANSVRQINGTLTTVQGDEGYRTVIEITPA
ncbi:GAF domain-containing sensor histidine kinase [Sphingomonas swuensis]|uniref:GAF domain-containing sensor histidine kinase n=1 Tax=Sphingomonas swuensis TaxID=977800 RepID=A0ABP7S7P6_9SPHN